MELREYWAILRRRWAAPVLLPVLVALFSAVQLRPWETPPPTYSASMRILVGVLPLEGVEQGEYDPRYYAWMTSEYLVDDFTEVLGSELFARAVNARLAEREIAIPAGLLSASANTGKQHRIIRLTFNWHSAAQLQEIGAAAVAELEDNAATYFAQLGTQGAGVYVMDPPVVVPVGPSARQRVEWPLRILLALVAGIGLAFLQEYLDDSVRRKRELEDLGLSLLVAVPKQRR